MCDLFMYILILPKKLKNPFFQVPTDSPSNQILKVKFYNDTNHFRVVNFVQISREYIDQKSC